MLASGAAFHREICLAAALASVAESSFLLATLAMTHGQPLSRLSRANVLAPRWVVPQSTSLPQLALFSAPARLRRSQGMLQQKTLTMQVNFTQVA